MEYSFYLNNFSFRTAANAFLRSGDLVNSVNNVPEVQDMPIGTIKSIERQAGIKLK